MKELTYARLIHHSFKDEYETFKGLYFRLFEDGDLTDDDVNKLLSLVILFSNQKDKIIRNFGYRIALLYSVKTGDYYPLYDVSINIGLNPIVALLKKIETLPFGDEGDSFLQNMVDSYLDNYISDGLVQTDGQYVLEKFSAEGYEESSLIVAPTSYGKSELIISTLRNNASKKMCVLVPSKSLLSQTKMRILNADLDWVERVISHPDMYEENDENSVYVLTQERLSRLVNQEVELKFDILIVDEAHNILANDDRNILLASMIRVLKYRNRYTAVKYLTPFLNNPESLKVRGDRFDYSNYIVSEYVKSENLYMSDFRKGKKVFELYDHFTDSFVDVPVSQSDPISYIKSKSVNKNVIYFNRPKHAQAFSKSLADSLPVIEDEVVNSAIREMSIYAHEEYFLLDCLKHGVVYHHGSMPDAIRGYVEYLYRTVESVRYLVTTSTLLEGINLPIERMFVLDVRKGLGHLKPSQFKNLIGRVNRFSEIFSGNTVSSLNKLNPQIHIVGVDGYMPSEANIRKFLKKVMYVNFVDKDKVENVLLEGSVINDENKEQYDNALITMDSIEPGIIDVSMNTPKTDIGLKLIQNNIMEIDVFENEGAIEDILEKYREEKGNVADSSSLITLIFDAFISFIDDNHKNRVKSLTRLKSDKAQMFYAMFLDWKVENIPLGVMVAKFVAYWKNLKSGTPVFVGSWGDVAKENSYREVFTYISGKTVREQVNLAIVRIKEEEDFLDYFLFRFVDVLNDVGLIDVEFYKVVKYGTSNDKTIKMIQSGFSRSVAELILSEYDDYYSVKSNGVLMFSPLIHDQMLERGVGFLQRNEVRLNVKK